METVNFEQFLILIQTPGWWFYVVLGSIVLNVLGSFFSWLLGNRIMATLGWWKKRQDLENQEYKKELDDLLSNPQQFKMFSEEEVRLRLKGSEYLGKAFFALMLFILMSSLFVTPKWLSGLFLIFGISSWFLQVKLFSAANQKERLLKDSYTILGRERGRPLDKDGP
ncbi:MAG: hypothetical protein KC643_29520 [Nitrospira sp.]|nr:hypothetical protein [Nitrospira sp.]